MSQAQSKYDQQLEIGQLYYERGDFIKAEPHLTAASEGFFAEKKFPQFLECMNKLLRIYAERDMLEKIYSTKERLQDLVLKEGFELNSRTYYTLALCASYKNQTELALEYLQKSLTIALATDNKEDMCYAICGTAFVYKNLGRYEEALKEIYNLQVFFQVIDLPEVKMSTQILNARILSLLKKYDQALDILWQTYETVRKQKTLTMHIYLLYAFGETYLMAGDKDLARIYLNLAQNSADPENFAHLAKDIQELMEQLGTDAKSGYDLVFDLQDHAVVERKLGKVDFKNQFILLDLLKLFVQNQGQVYSKEYLVEQVWKQNYDPAIHDNKIYVTIKRLRKLIEPDYDKPKYIFRAKNGYFMNKSVKVCLDEPRGGRV